MRRRASIAHAWLAALALPMAPLTPCMPLLAAEQAPAAAARERIFDLHVQGGKLAAGNRTIKVVEGDFVRLRWHADTVLTLHLHGYDVEREVQPGTVAEMTFTANMTGRFSISIHGQPAKGSHHHAPLAYLEVHP